MTPIRSLTVLLLIAPFFLLLSSGDPPPTLASAEVRGDLSAAFVRRLESYAGLT
jgi:hypothetical protein